MEVPIVSKGIWISQKCAGPKLLQCEVVVSVWSKKTKHRVIFVFNEQISCKALRVLEHKVQVPLRKYHSKKIESDIKMITRRQTIVENISRLFSNLDHEDSERCAYSYSSGQECTGICPSLSGHWFEGFSLGCLQHHDCRGREGNRNISTRWETEVFATGLLHDHYRDNSLVENVTSQ